jgi:hypothetical protein
MMGLRLMTNSLEASLVWTGSRCIVAENNYLQGVCEVLTTQSMNLTRAQKATDQAGKGFRLLDHGEMAGSRELDE